MTCARSGDQTDQTPIPNKWKCRIQAHSSYTHAVRTHLTSDLRIFALPSQLTYTSGPPDYRISLRLTANALQNNLCVTGLFSYPELCSYFPLFFIILKLAFEPICHLMDVPSLTAHLLQWWMTGQISERRFELSGTEIDRIGLKWDRCLIVDIRFQTC